MPLFEVAIILPPTKKEVEDGIGEEKLLMPPKFVLGKDIATAGLMALTGDDAPKGIDLNRAQVLVRPFAPPP